MTSSRMCKGVLCLAASVGLCGAPAYAQDSMGGTSGSGTNSSRSGANPGSTTGTSTGTMQGTSGMQDNSSMSGGSSGKVTSADKSFMKTAMEGDMAEIQLAQLAQQKASSDQVKQFAQRMIDDHTKLDAQMKPMAQQFGVEAPTDLSAKHKSVQSKLQGLSGAKFDQE